MCRKSAISGRWSMLRGYIDYRYAGTPRSVNSVGSQTDIQLGHFSDRTSLAVFCVN